LDDSVQSLIFQFLGGRSNERPFVEQQWDAFLGNLERIGIPRVGAAGWITWPSVVIRMRATTIFEQTPGPEAGALLVPRP